MHGLFRYKLDSGNDASPHSDIDSFDAYHNFNHMCDASTIIHKPLNGNEAFDG
jgi:hypothetical protein